MIPLTEQQEQAIGAAALSFGVETWEMAVHILSTAPRASVFTNGPDS